MGIKVGVQYAVINYFFFKFHPMSLIVIFLHCLQMTAIQKYISRYMDWYLIIKRVARDTTVEIKPRYFCNMHFNCILILSCIQFIFKRFLSKTKSSLQRSQISILLMFSGRFFPPKSHQIYLVEYTDVHTKSCICVFQLRKSYYIFFHSKVLLMNIHLYVNQCYLYLYIYQLKKTFVELNQITEEIIFYRLGIRYMQIYEEWGMFKSKKG